MITTSVMDLPMDTNKKIREHISALCDGELSASDIELAFAALQSADGQQTWEVYHRIGDLMRAQASPDLSPGFGARLAERLSAEPVDASTTPEQAALSVVVASSSAPAP
jgi:sigma-E factor negative regulatory protein RseA